MGRVLGQYERHMHQTPARVVVHKTSRFWPDERDGFRAAIESRARRYDLLALEAQSAVRLITTSKYPPLRGTRFTIGDLDYLYTTGYIAALGEFHGMHVPAPLQIADHVGQDTPREALLKEVLALTKLNWNSAALGGLLPVTIKFSRLVGQIMCEIPGTGNHCRSSSSTSDRAVQAEHLVLGCPAADAPGRRTTGTGVRGRRLLRRVQPCCGVRLGDGT